MSNFNKSDNPLFGSHTDCLQYCSHSPHIAKERKKFILLTLLKKQIQFLSKFQPLWIKPEAFSNQFNFLKPKIKQENYSTLIWFRDVWFKSSTSLQVTNGVLQICKRFLNTIKEYAQLIPKIFVLNIF